MSRLLWATVFVWAFTLGTLGVSNAVVKFFDEKDVEVLWSGTWDQLCTEMAVARGVDSLMANAGCVNTKPTPEEVENFEEELYGK